jgi:hypothetical protein
VEESFRSSKPSKKGDPKRLEHFADIVEWARSNGWTDFDFEGLERRVVELAKAMNETSAQAMPGSTAKSSDNLVRFARRLPGRWRSDV